jgi:hypothetical protein
MQFLFSVIRFLIILESGVNRRYQKRGLIIGQITPKICEDCVMFVENDKRGYVLAGLLGALGGSILIVAITNMIPKMMSKMMSGMMENMQEMIGEEGCSPEEF